MGPEELEAVQQPLQTGWLVQGPQVKAFEDAFSTFCGAPFSIATTSCTTALHLAVAAMDLVPGDEVLVPAFTWVSTANVVEYMGAKPVFCDIDPRTYNLDVERMVEKIGPRTVGVIPVHLFGLCADMSRIGAVVREHGLWMIEDCACALGAEIDGRHAGTFGNAGCFSFHPRKSITTGEGGMITTADPALDARFRSLRDHGASRSDFDRHGGKGGWLLADYNVLGYNYRMTDIQGALGRVQLGRAAAILAARHERAARYDRLLADFDWIRPPHTPPGYTHGYQGYVCMFGPPDADPATFHGLRNAVMERMESEGIATRQGTHAPVLTGLYSKRYNLAADDFPHAVAAELLTLALPLFPQLTDDEQDRVVRTLSESIATLR